ncbi:hypothetical protein [Psychrobacter sp. ANT_H56B]|uniref:hypothetical protein n=1 Tax=Psychrobacter sp. ANT_H56B TaxID=2597353 RepID=UPI0021D0AD2E|nr:hypothetical protein [Psychrobacter sp. ANT_H56B]
MNSIRCHLDELPPLTGKQQKDVQHLATLLPGDNLDLSDIPEVTHWSSAICSSIEPQAPSTEASVINPSIIAKFKDRDQQTGGNY